MAGVLRFILGIKLGKIRQNRSIVIAYARESSYNSCKRFLIV